MHHSSVSLLDILKLVDWIFNMITLSTKLKNKIFEIWNLHHLEKKTKAILSHLFKMHKQCLLYFMWLCAERERKKQRQREWASHQQQYLFIYFYSFIHMCIHWVISPPCPVLPPSPHLLPSLPVSALIYNFVEEKT
jgi:hypothetical protein